MKFVVQRVLDASVIIDNKTYSSIDKGLLVLIGISTAIGVDLLNVEDQVHSLIFLQC